MLGQHRGIQNQIVPYNSLTQYTVHNCQCYWQLCEFQKDTISLILIPIKFYWLSLVGNLVLFLFQMTANCITFINWQRSKWLCLWSILSLTFASNETFQCRDNEFSCDSGNCIDLMKRCDKLDDCEDGSDEHLCHLLRVDSSRYRKVDPPLKDKQRTNIGIGQLL